MNVLRLITFLYMLVLVTSCSKNEDVQTGEPVTTPQTELLSLDINGEAITITWRPVIIEGFISYKVYRYNSGTNEFSNINTIVGGGELLASITNNNQTSFTDNDIPYDAYVNYVIVTEYKTPFSLNNERATSLNHLFYERPELSFELVSVTKLENGEIEVKWEKDGNSDFTNYQVFSVGSRELSEYRLDLYKEEFSLGVVNSQNETKFIDPNLYKEEYVYFAVSKKVNGVTIQSKNSISIKNPSHIPFTPVAMFENTEQDNEVILVSSEGEILFYDTASLSQKSYIDLDRLSFHPTIGKYNGKQELYVPCENGKIFIYSLSDYSLLEEIDLQTESDVISVINKENYLIFLENVRHTTVGGLRYFDRISRDVERQGLFGTKPRTRLYQSKGNFFFRVEPSYNGHQNESTLHRYEIIDGKLQFTQGIDNGSIKSGLVFAAAPDFSYLVSTEYGFHLNLDYDDLSEERLGNYGYETSFDGFDFIGIQEKYSDVLITAEDNIYFSIKELNRIVVHKSLDFRNVGKEFDTAGKPLFFELLDNIIAVVNQGNAANQSFIQRIANE